MKRIRWTSRSILTVGAATLLWIAMIDLSFAENQVPGAAVSAEVVLRQAHAIDDEAKALELASRWSDALSLREKLVRLLEKEFGRLNPDTDSARCTVGESLTMLGRYVEARKVFNECLAVRREALGDRHFLVADALNRIGETYRRGGEFAAAKACFDQAAQILDGQVGQEVLLSAVWNNAGLVSVTLGDEAAAENAWSAAVRLLTNTPNVDPKLVAPTLSSLGELHRSLGQIEGARKEQELAKALLAEEPMDHPLRLRVDNNYAHVLFDLYLYSEAISLYTNVVNRWIRAYGPDQPDLLTIQQYLARAYAAQSDTGAALHLAQSCLGQLTDAGRTNHPLYGNLLLDVGDYQKQLGEYPAARASYQQALKVQLASLGSSHRLVNATRGRLGRLAIDEGELDRAQEWLQQALDSSRKPARGDKHSDIDVASALVDFANFEQNLGQFDRTKTLLEEAYRLQTNQLGMARPEVADTLHEAGINASLLGQYDSARQLFLNTLNIRSMAFGSNSVPVALTLIELANAHRKLGRSDLALREIVVAEKILAILKGTNSIDWASATFSHANLLFELGNLAEAAPLYDKALAVMERRHLQLAAPLAMDYAYLELARNNKSSALSLASRALEIQQSRWRNALRFSSQADRLAMLATFNLYSTPAALAEYSPGLLATAVLRFKGSVIESMLEDRQLLSLAADPSAREAVTSLRAARRKLLRLDLVAGSSTPPTLPALKSAGEEVDRLEGVLARRSAALVENRLLFTVTPENVRAALPPGAALIEFVQYLQWRGTTNFSPALGALVFSRDALRWVSLEKAAGTNGIVNNIGLWYKLAHGNSKSGVSDLSATQILGTLHEKLWQPIESSLPAATRIIIVSADGLIHFVPFAALWRTDRFLGEDFEFRYVSSGRDLIAGRSSPTTNRVFSIWADPQYSLGPAQLHPSLEKLMSEAVLSVASLQGGSTNELPLSYSPLPGTRLEGQELAELAIANGFRTELQTGTNATERRLRHSAAPYILHLSTHGTFLPDHPASLLDNRNLVGRKKYLKLPADPMARNWVALAGANDTMEAWRHGQVPFSAEDGILTAGEAATLDLNGTWLATLSACHTGTGEALAGEGLFGLQRGFAMAGVTHLLLSLWPVDDTRTREFMRRFYGDALKSGNAAAAMVRVQRQCLSEWRKQIGGGPGMAAIWAGAFVLNSRGID